MDRGLPDFPSIFRIPADHRLESAGALSRGGRVYGQCWFHCEYDRDDRLVARYETYDEVGAEGGPRCGWRRYDSEGRLTLFHEVAMRWAALVASAASRGAAEAALQGPVAELAAPA
ncbi:hypothetical protein M446_5221 [Methylobacterium sp. 4-46]|uniref:hypothetical protein n=1 Tax=unclassified Methylobacterium TaxID=2615210 RepID=UPI000165CAE1|nr:MULTISPECIES: hypothetical protein [Methylobacterium]ACA19546.1 hypothetical protein M446_5221 [Methylobacterium sp. 4-46]WFT78741.1 hypothetical protein QA634_26265 [Methylobacterium nodulans]